MMSPEDVRRLDARLAVHAPLVEAITRSVLVVRGRNTADFEAETVSLTSMASTHPCRAYQQRRKTSNLYIFFFFFFFFFYKSEQVKLGVPPGRLAFFKFQTEKKSPQWGGLRPGCH